MDWLCWFFLGVECGGVMPVAIILGVVVGGVALMAAIQGAFTDGS